jgi:hypothetical protein
MKKRVDYWKARRLFGAAKASKIWTARGKEQAAGASQPLSSL